jgi:hypothetical protein
MVYDKDMLSSAIPSRILAKMTTSKIVEHMVEVWNILHIWLPLVRLGRAEKHNLQSYLQLLDMIEKACHRELAEVDNEDPNAKSIKILQQEREHNFKELRGFGVDSYRFPGCTKCGHTFIDKPHSNKAKVKQTLSFIQSGKAIRELWITSWKGTTLLLWLMAKR